MSLRIGIDLFQLVPGAGRGAGFHRYTTGLVSGLSELDDDHQYFLFVNRLNAGMFPSGPRFRHVVIHLPPSRSAWPFRLWWHHGLLPLLANRYRLDVMHFPMDTASFALGRPYVVTIHDLIADVFYPNNYPESVSWLKARYLYLAKQHSGRHARAVICPSKATARGVRKHYGVPPERTVVIPEAIHHLFYEDGKPNPDPAPRPYILAVASLSPHKNLHTTVRAFLWAREAYHLPHELVIIGMRGTDAGPIERYLAAERGRGLPVRYLGFVDDRTLREAYHGASLLVYVSQVEGFGLPPLEAMASGTPVIASNISSLPEVCGDAARLVSPDDTEGLSTAIGDILTNPALARRLTEAGRERARNFSWLETARQTREVFERVAGVRLSALPSARRKPVFVSRRPRIGVVVVNQSGWPDTLECLESLRRAAPAADRIVVVDQAPGDDSVGQIGAWADRAAARWEAAAVTDPAPRHANAPPWLTVLTGCEARGLAAARNAGLTILAREPELTHFILISNDLVLEPDFFNQLAAALERVPDAGLLGATIYEMESPGRVWYAGGRFHALRGDAGNMLDVPADIEPRPTEFVTGCAMLVSRQAFEHLGPLPECYGFDSEDAEYSHRALAAGLRVGYAPGAVAHHRTGASGRAGNRAPATYFAARNRALFVRRNLLGWGRILPTAYLVTAGLAQAAANFAIGRGSLAAALLQGTFAGLLNRAASEGQLHALLAEQRRAALFPADLAARGGAEHAGPESQMAGRPGDRRRADARPTSP
ncbi:MAG: glycosyltransferase [Gemmatimonadetes bacterium]|nr:glycosyltransferase [Gemmatimonadota bacterium]